jgi:uncharacterized protein (DUF433 family)
VQVAGVRGGRPVIRGTGLTVDLIARFFRMGASPDERLATYPQLTPAALYDALSYYHDHREDIDRQIDEVGTISDVLARYGITLGEKGRVVFARSVSAS